MIRHAGKYAAMLCALGLALVADPRPPRGEAGEPLPPLPVRAAVAAAETPPPPSFPPRRTQVGVPENNPLEIYPPRDRRTRSAGGSAPLNAPPLAMPLTLALHGKDQDPLDLCDAWSEEGRAGSWLVCPAGNAPGEESFDWGGSSEERLEALDAQLAAVDALYGPLVDHERGDVLVGFSRGAFLARDLIYARPGRFRGVVLLGAAVRLDPERLRAAGVKRVLLAAGDLDGARPTMEHTAHFLASRGIKARFVSLGPIYHRLPDDLGRVMREALRWVRDEDRV